jgi:hypothetical protein
VRNAEWGVRSGECGVRYAEWGVGNAECGMRSAEWGMRVRSAECGMRSGECGVESAEWGMRDGCYRARAGTSVYEMIANSEEVSPRPNTKH